MAALMIAARRRTRLWNDGAALSDVDAPCSSRIQASSRFRSPALCQRSSGSFARQVRTKRSSAREASGCTADTGGGSSRRIALMRVASLVALNAFRPAVIS